MSSEEESCAESDDAFRAPVVKSPRVERVCHCLRSVHGPLTGVSERSWQSLLKAADVRNDDIGVSLKRIASSSAEPLPCEVRYHPACYQQYTSKTQLARLSARQCTGKQVTPSRGSLASQTEHLSSTEVQTRLSGSMNRTLRSSLAKTDKALCIVCQSERKDKKNRRVSENLRLCSTLSASANLIEAAELWQNERIMNVSFV